MLWNIGLFLAKASVMKYLTFFFGKGQPYKIELWNIGLFLAKASLMKCWFIFVYGQTYEILDFFFLLRRALWTIGLFLAKASLMNFFFFLAKASFMKYWFIFGQGLPYEILVSFWLMPVLWNIVLLECGL